MSAIMWTPPSPDAGKDEVEEELCVAVDAVDRRAIPFFTHDSGAILIKGGTVVNDDNMDVADVIIEEGKIAQVGQDLEVPSVLQEASFLGEALCHTCGIILENLACFF